MQALLEDIKKHWQADMIWIVSGVSVGIIIKLLATGHF